MSIMGNHVLMILLLHTTCTMTVVHTQDSNQGNCPTGLLYDVFKFRNMCYEFVNHEKTWSQAEHWCESKSSEFKGLKPAGRLVEILDMQTQTFIMNKLKSLSHWTNNGVWIGATDKHSEGVWKWTSGTPVRFTYWEHDQPSQVRSRIPFIGQLFPEDCALMRRKSGWRWHDYACESRVFYTYKFICQYEMLPQTTTTATPTSTTIESSTTSAPTNTTGVLGIDNQVGSLSRNDGKSQFIRESVVTPESRVPEYVGVAVGCIVTVIIVILLIYILYRRNRYKKFGPGLQFDNPSFTENQPTSPRYVPSLPPQNVVATSVTDSSGLSPSLTPGVHPISAIALPPMPVSLKHTNQDMSILPDDKDELPPYTLTETKEMGACAMADSGNHGYSDDEDVKPKPPPETPVGSDDEYDNKPTYYDHDNEFNTSIDDREMQPGVQPRSLRFSVTSFGRDKL